MGKEQNEGSYSLDVAGIITHLTIMPGLEKNLSFAGHVDTSHTLRR